MCKESNEHVYRKAEVQEHTAPERQIPFCHSSSLLIPFWRKNYTSSPLIEMACVLVNSAFCLFLSTQYSLTEVSVICNPKKISCNIPDKKKTMEMWLSSRREIVNKIITPSKFQRGMETGIYSALYSNIGLLSPVLP